MAALLANKLLDDSHFSFHLPSRNPVQIMLSAQDATLRGRKYHPAAYVRATEQTTYCRV
jgi:hypothetical protein